MHCTGPLIPTPCVGTRRLGGEDCGFDSHHHFSVSYIPGLTSLVGEELVRVDCRGGNGSGMSCELRDWEMSRFV